MDAALTNDLVTILEILFEGENVWLDEGLLIDPKKHFPKTLKFLPNYHELEKSYIGNFEGLSGLKSYISACKTFEEERKRLHPIMQFFVISPFRKNITIIYEEISELDPKSEEEFVGYLFALVSEKYEHSKDEILNALEKSNLEKQTYGFIKDALC